MLPGRDWAAIASDTGLPAYTGLVIERNRRGPVRLVAVVF